MVQWFKTFKLFILRFLGVKPLSVDLAIEETEDKIQKTALVIHAFAKDEAIMAVKTLLKAQQTRALFSLSSFGGSEVKLAKLQGHLEAIEGLLKFVSECEELKPEDIRALRAMKKKDGTTKVLKFKESSGYRSDISI
jgi:predicted RecB family endonuclease